ncbi:hypothetical protein [Nitratifractor salsuginis]|uniref:Lipoprotein n=1 Tax=Nitratifractor salsuginis (strain DSM 16511 / JCM 12458 / E9I37-1) TaxID=749222 RepID=E6WXN8_NITSE|nr:hypothetical protein [Nitratifractor salsuginis]ADV46295.1 hypothetical protein Nitsa_1037 [Nitratifractor salsuginis DSM 16511]
MHRISFAGALTAALVFLSACSDRHPYVKLYDKNLSKNPPSCLALQVFPPDPDAKKTLRKLYRFRSECPYLLKVTTKEGIVCRSNGNAPIKATSNFPSAYLRMELRRGMKLLYTYYIDLTDEPDASDIEAAFDRFKKDIPVH